MRKLLLMLIILAWVLVACAAPAGQPTQPVGLPVTGTEEVAVATPELPTAEPAAQDTPEPAAEATESTAPTPAAVLQEGAGESGVVAFAIVPEESTLTYEVGETFLDRGNVFNVAIGQTQGVTGDILVNFDQPPATSVGTMTADISGFTSDSPRRDGAIRDRFLQSSQFPLVTFTPTAIEGLPDSIEPGVEYQLTLQGDLTIRDTTQPAAFDARVRFQDDALTGQAVSTILMSDYGFGPIDILGVLKTEDQVKVTVDFVARPQ